MLNGNLRSQRDVTDGLFAAVRPENFQIHRIGVGPESEMQVQIKIFAWEKVPIYQLVEE